MRDFNRTISRTLFSLASLMALLLVACGGGVENGNNATPPVPTPPAVNQPPVASFNVIPASGAVPLLVQFDATASSDADGSITQYDWQFGNGQTASGVTTSHTYQHSGFFTVTLTVRDDAGAQATITRQIQVTDSSTACAEGTITAACNCGGLNKQSGYCCNNIWFDSTYATLTGGCPASTYYYVDPEHPSASDSNDGSASAPWSTLGRAVWGSQSYTTPNAAAAVQAGNVVLVRSGVHSGIGKDSRNDPVFNPVNEGSIGAPIVIKAIGNVTIAPQISYEGMVQSATATTVSLAADASTSNDAYANWTIRIVAGTGAGQARKIARTQQVGQSYVSSDSYDGASRTANLQYAWSTVPDTTSQITLTRPGPLLGSLNRDHIVWDGFRIVEGDSYRSDTGPVVIWGSNNVSLLHLNIGGTRITPLFDNHNGVRVEGAQDFLIASCEISGFDSPNAAFNNPQNEAAIMLYGDHGGIIENNLIHNVNTGIFPKGSNGTNLIIRRNIIHDAAQSIRVSYHSNVDIYQNLIYDSLMAIRGAEGNSSVRFYNNIAYRNNSGPNNWFGSDGIEFFNNVYLAVPFPYNYEGALGNFTSNHNHYFDYTGFRVGNQNIGGLSDWQALGYDAQATESDPLFMDPVNLNFRLLDNSPLSGGGRGGMYPTVRGIYISGDEVIGPRN